MLLWTFPCQNLPESHFCILLGRFLKVDFLGKYGICKFNFSWNCKKKKILKSGLTSHQQQMSVLFLHPRRSRDCWLSYLYHSNEFIWICTWIFLIILVFNIVFTVLLPSEFESQEFFILATNTWIASACFKLGCLFICLTVCWVRILL